MTVDLWSILGFSIAYTSEFGVSNEYALMIMQHTLVKTFSIYLALLPAALVS